MKLIVDKNQITEGLQKAASIIPPKAGAAYLRSVWLRAGKDTLSIMSTDANIEFTGTYPARVAGEGLIGVPGRSFVDLVRQLPPGELDMELDEGGTSLKLTQGPRSYRLPVSGPEWFQNFSEFPQGSPVVWSGDFLQDILERVTFCIGDDDALDAIACLCLKPGQDGRIDACGLNGHQFAIVSFRHDDLLAILPAGGVLIQKKYLADIKKWLGVDEIELNLTGKRLYLRRLDGAETLSVPRAGHEYPDYNVFMAKLEEGGASMLTLARKEGMEALSRILIFNSESERCVYMDLSASELGLSAQGPDLGSARETLDVSFDGTLDKVAFPTRNLLEIFGHFNSAELRLTLTGAEGPCGISGADDAEYLVIIMPMKVSDTANYGEDDD